MASNTERLGLFKKDSLTEGNDTFNLKTMLNDNWDKIDKRTALIDPETGKLLPGQENAVEVDLSGLATKEELQDVEEELATHTAEDATDAHNITNIKGLQTALVEKEPALNVIQKRPIYIQATAPENPQEGDIWIEVD